MPGLGALKGPVSLSTSTVCPNDQALEKESHTQPHPNLSPEQGPHVWFVPDAATEERKKFCLSSSSSYEERSLIPRDMGEPGATPGSVGWG